MKKNSFAFTLIELIVVMSILTILSLSSIFYFNSFIDNKKINSSIDSFDTDIKSLNLKVKSNEIYNYEIHFSPLYYYYYLNSAISGFKPNFSLDEKTKLFSLNSGLSFSGSSEITISTEDKLLEKKTIQNEEFLTGFLDSYDFYKIDVNNIVGETFLYIKFFSEDNLDYSGITTDFIQANTKEDKSGLSTTNFMIKNTNDKITFYSGETLWDTNQVYLFFDKAGVEKDLEIIR